MAASAGTVLRGSITEIFDVDPLILRFAHGLVQLRVDRSGMSVLGILNQKDHQQRRNRGPGVDHELPGIRVMKCRASSCPGNDYDKSSREGPFRPQPSRVGCSKPTKPVVRGPRLDLKGVLVHATTL